MHAGHDASLSINTPPHRLAVTKHVEALINGPLTMGNIAAHYLHQGFQHTALPFASLQHVADHPCQTLLPGLLLTAPYAALLELPASPSSLQP